MSVRTRYQRWRRRRRARGTRNQPLREFVYLDDVSVLSLMASRVGALPTEYRDSETTASRRKTKSSVGFSFGLLKGGLGTDDEGSHSSGREIVRISSIQSAFKEVYEYEKSSLILSPEPAIDRLPRIRQPADLAAEAVHNEREGWMRRADELQRGSLIEVEVSLDADDIFRFNVILATFLRFLDDVPGLAGIVDRETMGQMLMTNKVLERMLVGLVPLRGTAVDYRLVAHGGEDYVIHAQALEQLPFADQLEIEPLHIVGVAEENLFWKDIRRVLFAGGRYRMLCRISRDGVHRDWTPVKLVDLLSDVIPEMASNFDGHGLISAIRDAQAPAESEIDEGQAMVLERYVRGLAERHGRDEGEAVAGSRAIVQVLASADFNDVPAQRRVFNILTHHLIVDRDFPDDPEVAAELRESLVGWEAPAPEARDDAEIVQAPDDSALIDCEFVAIYW